ncbi:acetate--CoA ligase [Kyrpidia sp.]|uniref:acetate--CoA ligase n=1 Tax=Kyrpidia sp. TaxID=2073077 RepID=UPI002582A103|nr:acetate--CoA ligase [Kyrpidia sp.]MCL6577136.1 acetate--CoA ligase [Kyrpidia sp.]
MLDQDRPKMIQDSRKIAPPAAYVPKSYVQGEEAYRTLYRESVEYPESFWAAVASELTWIKPWETVMEGNFPDFAFFRGGYLNVSENCVDRHALSFRRNKVAIFWEGENGQRRIITYLRLHEKVQKFANVLKRFGIQKGDVVSVYMQNLPETFVALLAILRIGAIYNTVFAGFSPEALRERVVDSKAKMVICANRSYRRGRPIPLKENVDRALEGVDTVKTVIVYRRSDEEVPMSPGRDYDWHELMAEAEPICPVEPMEANEPGLLIYTSGTSGKPKGIVHAGGGFLVGTYAYTKYQLDLRDEDVYWNTADIGWLTSHIFVLIGGLALGVTTVLYEGALDYPHPGRLYEMVERYRVNKLFSAPTAYRMLVKNGEELARRYRLSTLELFASVGEPLNPEAWEWVYRVLGGGRAVINNTWGQTETGGTPLAGAPGAVEMKPGSCGVPFYGHFLDVVDGDGNPVPDGTPGFLVIRKPFPSLARDIFGNRQRYVDTYFNVMPGVYFTGDSAIRDEDGHFWVLGRVDDVINVSGHRISTMEMESALIAHPKVVEAAVVGRPDPVKGAVPVAFVILEAGAERGPDLEQELEQWVADEIGSFARPAQVYIVETMPRTRSGKIIRRMLRELIQEGKVQGDTTGLEDFDAVERILENLRGRTGF